MGGIVLDQIFPLCECEKSNWHYVRNVKRKWEMPRKKEKKNKSAWEEEEEILVVVMLSKFDGYVMYWCYALSHFAYPRKTNDSFVAKPHYNPFWKSLWFILNMCTWLDLKEGQSEIGKANWGDEWNTYLVRNESYLWSFRMIVSFV